MDTFPLEAVGHYDILRGLIGDDLRCRRRELEGERFFEPLTGNALGIGLDLDHIARRHR